MREIDSTKTVGPVCFMPTPTVMDLVTQVPY